MKVPSFLKSASFKFAAAGFACSVIGYGVWTYGTPVYQEFASSFAMKEFKQYGVMGTYHRHFFSFLDRFKGLAGLEHENETLNERVAELEKQNALLDNAKSERELASLNELVQGDVKTQTGSERAILLDSIDYELPERVSDSGLYALALGYFRRQEYEKTVVLFDHLLNLKEDQQFMKADNYLLNGIAWFHLKNYNEAHRQVDLASKNSDFANPIHRSAILWDALISKAEGNSTVSQAKLLKFLELYPHSEESRMINIQRSPAAGAHHE